ncbi:MAG: virulence RhuM family protein [Coriobacteriales bacterium]|nr:virulence RhuM family protein [Coriobacteriales bacterium]
MAKSNKNEEITIRSSAAEYLTFIAATGDSETSVEMRYEDENIWLTQKMIAELYGVDVRTINEHIQNIFSDAELVEVATIRNFRIVQTEGNRRVSREIKHYSLQMIIAVGFKVDNQRAVQFRRWANQIVKDYTIQGWMHSCSSLNTIFFMTSVVLLMRLQRHSPRANGRSTALCKTGCLKVISTTFWHWRALRSKSTAVILRNDWAAR